MRRGVDRRSILKTALGGALGLALAPYASPALAASRPTLTRLNDKLAVISGVGGNVVALSTSDGLVLVDSGAAEHTDALLSQLKELPGGGRVQTLFNTHYHAEQTGSNAAFGRAGATIIAHERTRQWLATDYWVPGEDRWEKARPKEAQPTRTFYTNGDMNVGGERIEYGYLVEAHTSGDIYVFFRDSNVLVVGDVASPDRDPVHDWFTGGWLGGRLDAQALLLKISNDQTKIVPGFGPVMTRAQLEAEHKALSQVFTRMVEQVQKGAGPKNMLEAGVLKDVGLTFKDPDKFLYDACKGLWAHHNKLAHDIV